MRQSATVNAKEGRADPVAACLYRGYLRRGEAPRTPENENSAYWGNDIGRSDRDGLRLYSGAWTQAFLDDVEGFPPESGKEGVDTVDATSGAWAWLEAHPPRARVLASEVKVEMGEQHDVHPVDRQERRGDRDRGGRWTP